MAPAICKKWWKVSLETNSKCGCVSACVPLPVTLLDMHKHTHTTPIWNKQMLGEGRNVHVIFHMPYDSVHSGFRKNVLANPAKNAAIDFHNGKRDWSPLLDYLLSPWILWRNSCEKLVDLAHFLPRHRRELVIAWSYFQSDISDSDKNLNNARNTHKHLPSPSPQQHHDLKEKSMHLNDRSLVTL